MKKIKLYYAGKLKNFGDALNIDICTKIFKTIPVFSSIWKCQSTFIGSTLDFFEYKRYSKKFFFRLLFSCMIKQKVKVWGSGFMSDVKNNYEKKLFRELEVYAVRGHLTKTRLEVITNQKLNNIALGDPGLLASYLIPKNYTVKYQLGLIPHYVDFHLPIWQKIQKKYPNSIIIDVTEKPMVCISNIVQCSTIISSSLHGLIVSDSFGIPNIRAVVSNNIWGGDFKFNDYYSVYGIDNHNKIDMRYDNCIDNINLKNIVNNYKISQKNVEIIKNDLIRTFPYK